MGRGNVGECKRLSTNPKLHSHPRSGFDVLRTVCQPNYRLLPTASEGDGISAAPKIGSRSLQND